MVEVNEKRDEKGASGEERRGHGVEGGAGGVKPCFSRILRVLKNLIWRWWRKRSRGNYKEDNAIPAYTAVVAVVRINFLFNKKFAFATKVAGKRLAT